MKITTTRRAVSFAPLLFLLAGVAQAQTPTPTLTPTVTPTPLTVSANAVYTLCSISSASSVCGRIRKAATQATTAAYLFQVTASGASYDIWVSCDNAAGGTTKTSKARLQYRQSYSLPVSDVGPCTVGVTPTWTSGTSVLSASITGDLTMLALPTPAP